jgi:amino acid transporter
MHAKQINCISGGIMLVLSLAALLAVLSGYFQPPQQDEGTAAHVFQLSIVALVPITLLYLRTADWKQPRRNLLSLVFPAGMVGIAFAALFYLEHCR